MRWPRAFAAIVGSDHEDSRLGTLVGGWRDRWRPEPLHETTIDGVRFTYGNRPEFKRIYADVFTNDEYAFTPATDAPRILDCGAHIGLSVLYLKRRFPHAHIVAFEPNPDAFALLARNVAQNKLAAIELVNAALAPEGGDIPFEIHRRGVRGRTWGGSGAPNPWIGWGNYLQVTVPSVRLSRWLDRPVDLLKMDIEGMETAVLAEAEPQLRVVRQIILEFHGASMNPDNDLDRLLAIFERAGFDVRMKQGQRWVEPATIERTDPFWLTI
ncbi:MAG TPA: FkbM family methyltransferase, partial [Thermomicrobiales bacterium]|nr:FkbM family methyltransferase [Thermomicrobiales bacterium]